MCRYALHATKSHFVCLPCRRTKKARGYAVCTECRKDMIDLGYDFRVPRRGDDNQWRKVALLVKNGVRFRSCGCCGPGYRPRTLADAKADLVVARRPRRRPYYQRPYEDFLREVVRHDLVA